MRLALKAFALSTALAASPVSGAAPPIKSPPPKTAVPTRRGSVGKPPPRGPAAELRMSIGGPGNEAPPPDPQDPDRARILRLQESLNSLVHGGVLGHVRVGMRVIEAGTGRTFYRQRATTLMDPASNQKVLATTTALMRLGADFRFRTEVTGPAPDADGVVHGDLVLRGAGDPSLAQPDLEELAGSLVNRGITRVEGGVLAEPRRLGATETAANERSPLKVSRSTIVVRIRPGAEGQAPLVSLRPAMDALVVRNHAITRGKGRGRVNVALLPSPDGRMIVDVTGRIATNHPGMVMSRVPGNQRLYAVAILRSALVEAGVPVKGPAGLVPLSTSAEPESNSGLEVLAVHHSQPLSVIIRQVNKESNNEWAERLLDITGAELFGGPATPDKGLRALHDAMDEIGIPRSGYVSTNGSGLGHANRLTADLMADLLQKLYRDPRWGPELLQSLSVGGVDGTTRNRFRGSPAAERVRAKTGTLAGKSCLSGYVGDGRDVLIFSILVDGIRGRKWGTPAVRAAQVSAVNVMMRYARGVIDAPTGEEPVPGVDFESGEDLTESDDEEGTPADGTKAGNTPPSSVIPPPITPGQSAPANTPTTPPPVAPTPGGASNEPARRGFTRATIVGAQLR